MSNNLKAMYYVDSEDLIMEVQRYPCLYDPNCEDYQNRLAKLQTWRDISKKVVGAQKWEGMSTEEKMKVGKIVQKRWKSLKDAFQRALKWQEERTEKGEPLKRPYIYFKQMSFLIPMFYSRTTRNTKEEAIYAKEEEEEYDEYTTEDGEYTVEDAEYAAADAVYAGDNMVYTNTNEEELITPEVSIRVREDDIVPAQKRIKLENVVERDFSNAATISNVSRCEHDADSMFMMSLIPTFRRIKPEDKVGAQIEILQVLKKYTCEPRT